MHAGSYDIPHALITYIHTMQLATLMKGERNASCMIEILHEIQKSSTPCHLEGSILPARCSLFINANMPFFPALFGFTVPQTSPLQLCFSSSITSRHFLDLFTQRKKTTAVKIQNGYVYEAGREHDTYFLDTSSDLYRHDI